MIKWEKVSDTAGREGRVALEWALHPMTWCPLLGETHTQARPYKEGANLSEEAAS